MEKQNNENRMSRRRVLVLIVLLAAVFSVFSLRLFQIQIVEGGDYADIANRTTTSAISIPASRGEILDRYLRPMTVNRTTFSVIFDYAYFPRGTDENQRKLQNACILALAKLLDEAGEEWNDTLPITEKQPYAFKSERENTIAALKAKLRMADYATAENCMDALIERYQLENYPAADQRIAAGVQFEMELRGFSNKSPFVFSNDVSRETMLRIKENNNTYIGVDVEPMPVREYASGTVGSHLLGTVTPIYAGEYEKKYKDKGYALNDLVGREGIEEAMEEVLRGVTGTRKLVKNAQGTVVESQDSEAPVPGSTVVLTLDSRLQQAAQQALADKIAELRAKPSTSRGGFANNGHDVRSGSAVVLDVKNGGLLACATWPGFDLSTYNQDFEALSTDPEKPLFNRALNGAFSIGSTMKPLVAAACLTENIFGPEDRPIGCDGRYHYYAYAGYEPSCMGRHGSLNVKRALAKSCNVFFYDAGRRLTIEKMNAYTVKFGLGQKTGIEIGEATGVMAGPAYSASVGKTWLASYTIQAAIGQGDNQFTPIQLAAYAMALANDGVRYKTHLVHSIRSYDGSTETVVEPEVAAKVNLSQTAIAAVREGMVMVTKSGGTAYTPFRGASYTLAAKTGTAENGPKSASGAPTKSDHGAFIAYAPVENPEVAIAVLLENGTSTPSSQVARVILDAYFNTKTDGLKPTPEGQLLP